MQDKKEMVLKALAKIVKEKRGEMSITQLSLEVDVSKSIWSMIEKAQRDTQLTTLFRVAEALYVKPSQLLADVERELGENFSFIEN
ncbi:helix-turn-helix transcriptional regulator [bacterium]|nr:helix-turn-helix transcriptional regulator [bacterium]